MPGGPSQIDTFDPKPQVTENAGKPIPIEKPRLEHSKTGNLFASPWKFARHGESGIEVSELLPNLAGRVDSLCVIRSMVADNINHTGAALQINTGEQAFSRPSMGAWLTYGLGTENQNLPGFVVISPQIPFQGAPLWSNSFLPGAYQGTLVQDLQKPISNLSAANSPPDRQRTKLDAIAQLNRRHQTSRPGVEQLEARIASFELAYRMQLEAPEAFDLSRESQATQAAYGIGTTATDQFGKQCLMARRLVERGVRFVQVNYGSWDHHSGIQKGLPTECTAIALPCAALLNDLKSRGLLEDTLVVWGGEFGRTPTAQATDGREHHPFGFTMWLAGGGVKSGKVIHGANRRFRRWHAIKDKVHVDLHATILHLMGLDHERLTYRYGGRDYRLTDVHGRVVREIFA